MVPTVTTPPPIAGNDALSPWRIERGDKLRQVLQLPGDTLLASRDFRDSWMYFDERMDQAVVEGWLGNRQQIVKSSGVAGAIRHSVRVIDIEELAFHYRARSGTQKHVTIGQMESCLQLVNAGLKDVGTSIVRLLPAA